MEGIQNSSYVIRIQKEIIQNNSKEVIHPINFTCRIIEHKTLINHRWKNRYSGQQTSTADIIIIQ